MYKTEQENFWAGDFGNDYISRNNAAPLIAGNLSFFARILQHCKGVQSVVELGANIGLNLRALQLLLPSASLTGVEINEQAYKELRTIENITAVHSSLFDYTPVEHTLAFTKGVLIHLNPDLLPAAYEKLYACSSEYILIAEYYNPSPVEVPYRGHAGRLFKRDFAGELMKQFSSVKLLDYGFVYKGDPAFPQDDLTWFLLKKW